MALTDVYRTQPPPCVHTLQLRKKQEQEEKRMERVRQEVEKEQQQMLDAATSDLNGQISEEQAAAAAAAAGSGEQVTSRGVVIWFVFLALMYTSALLTRTALLLTLGSRSNTRLCCVVLCYVVLCHRSNLNPERLLYATSYAFSLEADRVLGFVSSCDRYINHVSSSKPSRVAGRGSHGHRTGSSSSSIGIEHYVAAHER